MCVGGDLFRLCERVCQDTHPPATKIRVKNREPVPLYQQMEHTEGSDMEDGMVSFRASEASEGRWWSGDMYGSGGTVSGGIDLANKTGSVSSNNEEEASDPELGDEDSDDVLRRLPALQDREREEDAHSPSPVKAAGTHIKINSRGDGRPGSDNSLVVSMDINGIMYQGVLFAQQAVPRTSRVS